MDSDSYNSLSEENKKIAERYVRFCIRGKLGTVPVLLSNDLFQCITFILKFREKAKVPKNNPYVFRLPGFTKNRYRYLRACILMRKFSEECNAMRSTSLRGTILRKHIATHCIQMNLNDVDISDFATFMGHADKVHREHYRQPLAVRDILKISQYLEAVQGDIENSSNESLSNSEIEQNSDSENIINISNEINITSPNTEKVAIQEKEGENKKRKRSTSPYGKTKRSRWTEHEKNDALQAFAKHMENLTLPSLKEIQEMKKKYTSLTNRTSPQIKTWLHNKQKALRN
ncbi:hypothetical protein ACS0PU_010384 [Formica fusca]